VRTASTISVWCVRWGEALFVGVYAATTLGQFLREFTHGHTQQLASVLRAHLVNLVRQLRDAAWHRPAGDDRH
jgi:hypothetical protein